MDQVIVSGLTVPARIGCFPGEHEREQDLAFTACISVSSKKVTETKDTVCYSGLRELIIKTTKEKPWGLLEELAEEIFSRTFKQFQAAEKINLEIRKFVFSDCDWAGVRLERDRVS